VRLKEPQCKPLCLSTSARPTFPPSPIRILRYDSASDELTRLDWTSCGLSYAQGVIYPELKLDKICGAVTDSEGAVISKAQVMLLADGEDAITLEQMQSGTHGQFAFVDQPEGTYQLLVKSPGFRPFLRIIHLQSAGISGSCQQPIPIRLEVM